MSRQLRACGAAAALLVMASVGAEGQVVQVGSRVRVWAPSHFFGYFEGVYAGGTPDTAIVRNTERVHYLPIPAISALHVSQSTRRAGAKKGALWGGGIAAAIGLLYASDGVSSAVALLPSGLLVGAIGGAVTGGRAWTSVPPSALRGAPPAVVAQAPLVARDSVATRPPPASTNAPLPPGFLLDQMSAGARTGAIGAAVGLAVGGVGAAVAAAGASQDQGLNVLGGMIGGALLGYMVGAPIGVHSIQCDQIRSRAVRPCLHRLGDRIDRHRGLWPRVLRDGAAGCVYRPQPRTDGLARAQIVSETRLLNENPATAKAVAGFLFLQWAWEELNLRPHAYQACALTT